MTSQSTHATTGPAAGTARIALVLMPSMVGHYLPDGRLGLILRLILP